MNTLFLKKKWEIPELTQKIINLQCITIKYILKCTGNTEKNLKSLRTLQVTADKKLLIEGFLEDEEEGIK